MKEKKNFIMRPPTLSIVIVTYNTKSLLPKVLSSIKAASDKLTTQTIIIDNASTDGSVDYLRASHPELHIIENNINVGFGRANNQSLPFFEGEYLLLLNPDAFISPDTLEKTTAYMEVNPQCGILGVKLVGESGELQPSCRYIPTPWNIFLHRSGISKYVKNVRMVDDLYWDHASPRICDWVPGCFYLVRREVVEQIGLFDPRYFLYFEEVDHCLAAKKAGWEVHYCPYTTVTHIGGESAKTEGELTESGKQLEKYQVESELLFFRKNYGVISVIGDAILNITADLINIFKGLLRPGRLQQPISASFIHSKLVLGLFFRTRYGSKTLH